MRVHFEVHGKDAADLRSSAVQTLRAFADSEWDIEIDAYPAQRSQDGQVLFWRADVSAENDR